MPQEFWNIVWNVVGGVIVVLLTLAYQWTARRIKHKAFRQVFGDDLNEFYIVYPSYETPTGTVFTKPKTQVPRRTYGTKNIETVNSNATTRSVSYLASVFSNFTKSLPHITSDIEMDQRMDISFMSVGGMNNYKSLDILENSSNVFLHFDHGCIESRTLHKCIAKIEGTIDCGLILKLHPSNNRKRTWLCVAGIGEWGTSGAAWWLSRNWNKVQKRAKDKPFACITKTTYRSDDSTYLDQLFLSQEEVEDIDQG